MNRSLIVLALASLPLAVSATPTLSLHSSNQGIGSITYSVSGNTITLNENWTSVAPGMIEISGLDFDVDYVLVKNITNATGADWASLANELLDPDNGSGSNDDLDPKPYPSFVPTGFSISNDNDGLSFAQGSGIPRTSNIFLSLIADELTDARDFLDFYNGVLLNGGSGTVSYGLRDNSGNQPFLLSERPNAFSVPVPGTLLLGGLGLAGIVRYRRRTNG